MERLTTIDYGEIRIVINDMYLKDDFIKIIDGSHGEQYEIKMTIHGEIVALLLDINDGYIHHDED